MRRGIGAAILGAATLVAAGCGTGGRVGTGDASHGKQIFSQKCASCHTLADAGATGTVGPNLDEAFRYDRKQRVGTEDTIQQIVAQQIKTAYPPMPNESQLFPKCKSGQSSDSGCSSDPGADTKDVATYVSSVAGKGAAGGVAAPTTPAQSGKAAGAPPGGSQGPAAQGKRIFASAGCNACHTLKDAGASGKIGPDLDQLKPDEPAVERQVTNGGGAMPAFKGQLSDEQIKAVAAYVSSVAGK